MSFNTAPNWEIIYQADEIRRAEQIQKVTNPESASTTLGNIALVYIFGGALGGAMPKTEALVLEGLATTTEVAERLEYR